MKILIRPRSTAVNFAHLLWWRSFVAACGLCWVAAPLFANAGQPQRGLFNDETVRTATPYYVVPRQLVQSFKLEGEPVLLAFSPDGQQLAVANQRSVPAKRSPEPLVATEAVVMPVDLSLPAKSVIPATSTAGIAVYGAFAIEMTWPASGLALSVSDGDEDLYTFHYLSATAQVQETEFQDVEAAAALEVQQKIQHCFPDWSQQVISSGVNGMQSPWLTAGKTTIFQPHASGVAADIWLLDLALCQRRILFAEPTDGQFVRYQAAAQHDNQLLLAVETGPLQQQDGRSLLVLTDLSEQQLRWQQQSYVLDKKHQLKTLAQLGSRQLLVAQQPWAACGSQLFSLSAAGLVAIALDGVTLCAVAASIETGQLALSVSKNWQRADDARPEQVWLLSPEFLQRLPE